MKPQSILSLRGAADLDKREQVITFSCPYVHTCPDASFCFKFLFHYVKQTKQKKKKKQTEKIKQKIQYQAQLA